MDEEIHIRLDQPKGLRKALLESALHSSEFLQTIEKVQHLEQERLQVKEAFSRAMIDVGIAMNQLVKTLPPLPLEFIQKQQQVLQRQMLQQQPLRVLTPRQELASRFQSAQQAPPSFTSPLEDEINELKRKIQSLSV